MAVRESEGILEGVGATIERVRCTLCNSSIQTKYYFDLNSHLTKDRHLAKVKVYHNVKAQYPQLDDDLCKMAAREFRHDEILPEGTVLISIL